MITTFRDERFIMVDQLMRITASIKAAIAVPFIGIYRAAGFDMLLNQSLKRGALHVRDGNRSNGSIALDKSDYRSLAGRASTALPFSFAAKVRFIDLNRTEKLIGERVSLNSFSYLRKHLPGNLVGHPNFVFQLISGNPNLKEGNCAYPLRDRRPCLLKDGAGSFRKRILTAPALIFKAVLLPEPPDYLIATIRTSHSLWPTNFVKKLTACRFVSKIKSIIVKPHRDLLYSESVYPSIQLVPLRG